MVGCLVFWYWIRCGIVFGSDGWSSWVGYTPSQPLEISADWGCFLVGDYLWRQEKHINRKVYILVVGESGLFFRKYVSRYCLVSLVLW